MADTFKVITCPMDEVERHLNENADSWALHLFIPNNDQTGVTIVLLNSRVLRMQQLARN